MADITRLKATVDPSRTVVVTMELQKGIVGDAAILPQLPLLVKEAGVLPAAGRVCKAARQAGVRVLHAVVEHRPDGAGQSMNSRIFAVGAKKKAELGFGPTDIGQPGVDVVDELDPQPSDIKVARIHGMTPFNGTELDSIARNLGARTCVIIGVSLNLGIIGAALSAVDLGYQVVIVREAVVGIPREYGEAMLENSISMIATVVTVDELEAAWA